MDLKRVCEDIKALKIQGAENVSTAALEATYNYIKKSKYETKFLLQLELEHARIELVKTRPTEPSMRNYLEFIINYSKSLEPKKDFKQKLLSRILLLIKEKKNIRNKIIINGESIIKNNSIIYTHCHSGTVTAIIKAAHKTKKIEVHNTETRPLFQGRKTAKELIESKIKVKHYVDSAVIEAMKNTEIILLGADAVTYNGVYNKIGSEIIGIIADKLNKPIYICTSLWKFDKHLETIEERDHNEIWPNHPKGLEIHNPAFEKIPFSLIKGIICEEGILKPKKFVKKARKLLK